MSSIHVATQFSTGGAASIRKLVIERKYIKILFDPGWSLFWRIEQNSSLGSEFKLRSYAISP